MITKSKSILAHPAVPWCAITLFLGVNIAALVMGKQVGESLADRQAFELGLEDREVCTRLLAPPGSENFISCAIELDGVRQQQSKRIAAWSDPL